MHTCCLKHGTHHKAYKQCIKHNPKTYKSNMGTNTLYTEKHHQYIKSIKQNHPWIMSLNQTLTITTMYQTHNNNNYPKHKQKQSKQDYL